MKKIILLLFFASATLFVSAQLKVQTDGKTVAYSTATAPIGTAQFSVFARNLGYGLYVSNSQSSDIDIRGIYSTVNGIDANTHNLIGLYGYASNGYIGQGVNVGVLGTTGWTVNGKNYGVYGSTTATFRGAGIIGMAATNTTSLVYPDLTERFAGYFFGNVSVTNLLTANSLTITSDIRYKTNIQPLSSQNVLSLNPVIYNYKQRFIPASDTLGNAIDLPIFDEKSQLFQKNHYGLIAQEVKELFPDLVYEDSDGFLSVDYIGIIPLLIQSIKEQNARIEALEQNNLEIKNAPTHHSPQNTATNRSAELFQNTPNPFTENTEIAFYLSENVKTAMICVYDMNGKQLLQSRISERGSSKFILNFGQYGAGMYLYSLIADNQVVDTKRMILTK